MDVLKYTDFVNCLFESASQPNKFWSTEAADKGWLIKLCEFLGHNFTIGGVYAIPQTRRSWLGFSHGFDYSLTPLFGSYYYQFDPWVVENSWPEVGVVEKYVFSSDVYQNGEYGEWLKMCGLCDSRVGLFFSEKSEGAVAPTGLSFYADRSDRFTPCVIEKIKAIRPLLATALNIAFKQTVNLNSLNFKILDSCQVGCVFFTENQNHLGHNDWFKKNIIARDIASIDGVSLRFTSQTVTNFLNKAFISLRKRSLYLTEQASHLCYDGYVYEMILFIDSQEHGTLFHPRYLLTVRNEEKSDRTASDKDIFEALLHFKVTKSECAVIKQLMKGSSTLEIAKKRDVATNTVQKQLNSIFSKLGVRGRPELILFVQELLGI